MLDQFRERACPPSLVAGAESGAVVPVEVFVKQQVIAPVRVRGENRVISVHGASALGVGQEDVGQALADFLRYPAEVELPARAGRTFHLEIVAVVEVQFPERARAGG
jgi:hypothetical protein